MPCDDAQADARMAFPHPEKFCKPMILRNYGMIEEKLPVLGASVRSLAQKPQTGGWTRFLASGTGKTCPNQALIP